MLSALLPGVREFRTPLVTGLLWGACLWLVIGFRIAESQQTSDFVERFELDVLPRSAWLAAGVLLAYLLGSLLVVRSSPIRVFSNHVLRWLETRIERLDEDRVPMRRHHRFAWRVWRKFSWRRPCNLLRDWAHRSRTHYEPVDSWLYNEFEGMLMRNQVPVMRNFDGGCNAPTGFDGLYERTSHADLSEDGNLRQGLSHSFVQSIKEEKPAVEVRIQMRFPEVYAEIDRLKVEAELRMSIFWPLTILCALLAWYWSPWALLGLALPPFLLVEGFRRSREASEKTWGAFISGEVSTPIYDAIKTAQQEKLGDFSKRLSFDAARHEKDALSAT